MSKLDVLLEELIESQVDGLIQEDAYYEMFATPLKPASSFKSDHRKQLIEFFQLKELRSQLEVAPSIILDLLPSYVSAEEFSKIKEELDQSGAHFLQFIETIEEKSDDKPILFQEMFGLSDDTLIQIYDLAVDLVKKGNYKDALTLFVFLTTLAPHVPSYWIAQGACLQALDRHEEAVAIFGAAKFLNPQDPAPLAYSIESYLILKEKEKVKEELQLMKEVVSNLPKDEKAKWEPKIKEIESSLS